MLGLGCDVHGCGGGTVVGGFLGDEECWDGDVDACWWRGCHIRCV